MSEGIEQELTRLLERVQASDEAARNELAALVNDRLRQMARRRLGRKFDPRLGGLTIQPTALANEAFMRLLRQRQKFDNTGHFFAIASQEMQRVLLDYCRQRRAGKRGRAAVVASLAASEEVVDRHNDIDYLVFNDALEQLAALDQRKADVVRYRLLWGMSIDETADALNVGHATIERDWQFAKAWLARQLSEGDERDEPGTVPED